MVSGLPAIAAMPTAIMAPEINPPGRCAHKNSVPPTVPIASVSSTLRVLVRLGMANAIDAGIWLTPPYDKSLHRGQMRQRDCSNARFYLPWKREGRLARRAFARLRKPGGDQISSDDSHPNPPPCRAIGFTHLENRLKYRDLEAPRFWKRLYVGPSATVDKTHVFRTCRPSIKRCVHSIAGDRACLPPSSADMACPRPVGPIRLRKLDASVGASGPHDFAVRSTRLRQRLRRALSASPPKL